MSALRRFVALYATMYAAFGVSSPFLPAFFEARGLAPEQLGVLFATGTAIRLISGPLCGRLADLTQALRAVLAVCATLAALVALGLLSASSFSALLMISVLHAAALAPITTLADALALGAAAARNAAGRFEYGWVRGTGSAVFIIGTLVSGQVVGAWGLTSIIVLHAALLFAAAGTAMLVPDPGRQAVPSVADHPPPAGAAVSARDARRRARARQSCDARCLRGDPLDRGRRHSGDGERAVVGVGGGRGRRLLRGRPAARDAPEPGRRRGARRHGRRAALGGHGVDHGRAGPRSGAAPARAHLRGVASGLHAADTGDRPAASRGDGAGDVCAGRRGDHRAA